jgi:hypothetical protein
MKHLTPWLLLGGGLTLGAAYLTARKSSPALAPGQVPAVRTPLRPVDARAALREAFQATIHRDPTTPELNMLAAQSALETRNWQAMWNYNFGNITTNSDPWYTLGTEATVGAHRYRPFNSASDGAAYYVAFLKRRYPEAWKELGSSDTLAFAQALKDHGYYEGDAQKYAQGLDSRYAKV